MKKTLMVSALALLALSACTQKEDVPNVTTGNTFASLTVAPSQTRAAGDENATASEVAVLGGTLYGEASDANANYRVLSFIQRDATKAEYTAAPWKTTAGARKLALLVNDEQITKFANVDALTQEANPSIGEAAMATIEKAVLTAEGAKDVHNVRGIFMSAKENVLEKTLAENISRDQAQNVGDANNHFKFSLVRSVAQAKVVNKLTANATGTYDVKAGTNANAPVLGTLEDLSFSVAGSKLTTTVYAVTTPNNAVTDRVKLGDDAENTLMQENGKNKSLYAPIAVGTVAESYAENQGIYMFETIPSGSNGTWKEAAYVKVYGYFIPSTIYELKGEGDNAKVEVATEPLKKGEDFYFSGESNKFYKTVEAVQKDGVKAMKYLHGKMVYKIPVNAQLNSDGDYSVLRNNIYRTNITGINGIGLNYDPQDENDPNIPKPGTPNNPANPTEPEDNGGPDDDDPLINSKNTHMAVTGEILPWTTHSKDQVITKW